MMFGPTMMLFRVIRGALKALDRCGQADEVDRSRRSNLTYDFTSFLTSGFTESPCVFS